MVKPWTYGGPTSQPVKELEQPMGVPLARAKLLEAFSLEFRFDMVECPNMVAWRSFFSDEVGCEQLKVSPTKKEKKKNKKSHPLGSTTLGHGTQEGRLMAVRKGQTASCVLVMGHERIPYCWLSKLSCTSCRSPQLELNHLAHKLAKWAALSHRFGNLATDHIPPLL